MKKLYKISLPLFIVSTVLMIMMIIGISYVFLCGESIDALRVDLDNGAVASSVAYRYLSKITFDKRIIFAIVFYISVFMSFVHFKKASFVSNIFMIVTMASIFILLVLSLNCLLADSGTEGTHLSTLYFFILPVLFIVFYFPSIIFSAFAKKYLEQLKAKPLDNQQEKPMASNEKITNAEKPIPSVPKVEENMEPFEKQQEEFSGEAAFDEVSQAENDSSESNAEDKNTIVNNKVDEKSEIVLQEQSIADLELQSEQKADESIEEKIESDEKNDVSEKVNSQPEETSHIEEMVIENKSIEIVHNPNLVQPQPIPRRKISVDEYIRLFQSDLIMADLNNKYIFPKKRKNDGAIRWDSFEQGMIVSLDEQVKETPANTEGVVLGINRDYTVDIGFIIRGKKVILAVPARQLSIKGDYKE